MNNVDARQVLQMFAVLDSKRQKKAHRTALRKATGILVRETRKNFRKVVKNPNARNRWNGKTFSSGIKSKVNKEATSGKVLTSYSTPKPASNSFLRGELEARITLYFFRLSNIMSFTI